MIDMKNASQSKNSRLGAITSDLKEWASTTSFHGFPNIARSENVYMTIVWVICTCASAGYCTYSIFTSVLTFLEFNVITQIQNVYENPAPFPAVTLCNLNPFVTEKAHEFVEKLVIDNFIFDVTNSELLSNFFPYPFQAELNTFITRNLAISNAKNQPDTVKQTFGNDFNTSLPMCFYNMDRCNSTEFNWFYSSDYGNCYQYNREINDPNDAIYTYKTGLKYGLGILMFTGFPKSVNSLTFGHGGHLFIHNQTTAPNSVTGLDIAPGLFTNIAINRVFSRQLPDPYNDCYEDLTTPDKFDSFYYRETLKSGYTYRQMDCLNLVEQDQYTKICNCSDPGFPALYNTPYCSSINQTFCSYTLYIKLFSTGANKDWFKYCPLECSTSQFVFTTSNSRFPSKSLSEILLKNTYVKKSLDSIGEPHNIESLKDNYAYVNIYYDYTGYTMISESPAQELVDLLSSVGGTMGLYIGISFLSFVEVFELFVQLALTGFRYSHTKKSSKITTAT